MVSRTSGSPRDDLLTGWPGAPRVTLVLAEDGGPGWEDSAFWATLLEAWGFPADRLEADRLADLGPGCTTIVAPAAALDTERVAALSASGASPVLAGAPLATVEGLGLVERPPVTVDRFRFDDPDLRARSLACLPEPDSEGAFRVDAHTARFDADGSRGWVALARWVSADAATEDGPTAIAVRRGEDGAVSVWFGVSAEVLDWRATEAVVEAADVALRLAAPRGLVGFWRWPSGKSAALVVDGDVDHPSGVDPECSRYVAPALEAARRAGFAAYGIFAAAANVDAEPASFPPAAGYYNHSYSHPYSHWDPRRWEELNEVEMEGEIRRSSETFRCHLGRDDEGIFRLPHFQLEACDRTYAVLDRLGYRADSSIGANVSIAGGLQFNPALFAWSERPADAAFARSHPGPEKRHALLQLPISTDPSSPSFPHGCCSYNTLREGVRSRTVDPAAYESVLDDIVERAVARRALAHVFFDPPDAGYGRLRGDRMDYASAVERWLRRAVARSDLAILTTAELATWWRDREAAISRLRWDVRDGELRMGRFDAPPGTTLALLRPRESGARPEEFLLPWIPT